MARQDLNRMIHVLGAVVLVDAEVRSGVPKLAGADQRMVGQSVGNIVLETDDVFRLFLAKPVPQAAQLSIYFLERKSVVLHLLEGPE